MLLSIKEAAHEARMTIVFLRWCSRYAVKRDGRKLNINKEDHTIDEEELRAFDAHMRTAWPDRYLGVGVLAEVNLEARGRCGVCNVACNTLIDAHIDRKGKEADYYFQHPHNIIKLCGICHPRYDNKNEFSNDQIKHYKDDLLSRLMETVDRDVRIQNEVRAHLKSERVKEEEAELSPLEYGKFVLAAVESVLTGPVGNSPASMEDVRERLKEMSKYFPPQEQITRSLIDSFISQVEREKVPAIEEDIDIPFEEEQRQPGECMRCVEDTRVEYMECMDCGEVVEGDITELLAVARGGRGFELHWGDYDLKHGQHICDCGCDQFDGMFEALCDYCAHMSQK